MRLQRVCTARAVFIVVAALLGMAVASFPASAAGFAISGTVSDASSGAGIAGAQVTTQPSTTSTTTDASGNYSIIVAPGTYNVIATIAGYNSNFRSVTVSSGGVTANLALASVPSGSAQDLFTRQNQSGFGTATDGHAWSTDNGTASVSITNGTLSFQTSGSSVDGWMGISYQDQVVSADINVSSGTARVLARVISAGTWVALIFDPGNDDLVLYSVSNNQWSQIGFWAAAPNLSFNSSYHVRLEAVGSVVAAKEWLFGDPEPAWDVTATQTVVNGAGVGGVGSAGASSVVSSFTESPVTQISGKVSDSSSGQPIANSTVSAGGSTATTDTSGAYTLGGLTAGTYTVSATAPNYAPGASSPVTVSTGVSATANMSLQYSPTPPQPPSGNSTIAGTVSDATTGALLSGALVTVPGNGGGSVTTNSAGQYTMSINAGVYNVVVTASGYNSNYAATTTAVGSPATANVALTAVPPLAAEDLFTRPNQSGIGTATDGHLWTDDHAVYNLGNEQIAGNQLVVQTAARSTDYDAWMGYSYQDQQVSVDFNCLTGLGARVLARVQGEETWIALVVGGSGSIVLWAAKNGSWTLVASSSLTVPTNTWYHAKLATIGNKVYGKVWAVGSTEPRWQVSGSQTVVNGAGYGGIRTAGADTDYQNFLESPITQIAGQVTDATTGNPISGATVSASGGPSTTTDVNGLYTLSGLAPGTYSVTAAATGYNASTQSATVSIAVSASLSYTLTSTSGGGNQTYVVQDTFTRANQSGWGTASNGMVWSAGSGLSIVGNEGMVSNSSSSQFETLGNATTTDGNGLVRFSVAATNDTAGILLRQSSGTGMLARYDGGGNLQLMVKSGGGGWTGVAKTPVTVNAGSFYWLRFLVQGTTVSLKLWQSGTPEPSAWTWSGTNSIVTGAGTMGLYAWAAAAAPVSIDNFSVASLTPPPPTLTAALTVTPGSGYVPVQVTADASSSTSGVNPIASYTFTFGDGTTVGPQSGATATHTYTAVGSYTVQVTVSDASGASSTASSLVMVQPAPPAAALTVSPTSGTVPFGVTADASTSTAGTNPISSYNFNFGDGTTTGPQTAATATHTYTTGGSFTVTVTVTASDGTTGTATAAVTAISSTIAQDTFQRANQTGWGTASNGMVWSSGSGLSIANNEGLITNSSSSQYETLGGATCTDGNGLVRFSVAAANDTAGVILRYQSNGDMMLARYDGAGNLEFMVKSGGTWTIVSKTPVSVSTNTFYWLRFLVQGTNVSLKVWKSGTTEPSAYTWTGTSSAVTAAGKVGLYGWAASGAPVSFDSFSVN